MPTELDELQRKISADGNRRGCVEKEEDRLEPGASYGPAEGTGGAEGGIQNRKAQWDNEKASVGEAVEAA